LTFLALLFKFAQTASVGSGGCSIYLDILKFIGLKCVDDKWEEYFTEFRDTMQKLKELDNDKDHKMLNMMGNTIFVMGLRDVKALGNEIDTVMSLSEWPDAETLMTKWTILLTNRKNAIGSRDAKEGAVLANKAKVSSKSKVKKQALAVKYSTSKKRKEIICWNCGEKGYHGWRRCSKPKARCSEKGCGRPHHTSVHDMIVKNYSEYDMSNLRKPYAGKKNLGRITQNSSPEEDMESWGEQKSAYSTSIDEEYNDERQAEDYFWAENEYCAMGTYDDEDSDEDSVESDRSMISASMSRLSFNGEDVLDGDENIYRGESEYCQQCGDAKDEREVSITNSSTQIGEYKSECKPYHNYDRLCDEELYDPYVWGDVPDSKDYGYDQLYLPPYGGRNN